VSRAASGPHAAPILPPVAAPEPLPQAAFEPAPATDLVRPVEEAPPDIAAGEPLAPAELAPVPLVGFVLARLGYTAAPELPTGAALRLIVDDEAHLRADAALAAVGVRWEPAFRRAQGRRSGVPLGSAAAPFFRAVGPGEVWVAGPPGRWLALALEDDVLYVREDRVLAFDGGVSWEAGAIPGDGLRMLQFRGRGCVVLEIDQPPAAVKISDDRPALIASARLYGWVGRLVAHKQRAAVANPFSVACQGDGVILFDGRLAAAGGAS
jgi:hypothetical protein